MNAKILFSATVAGLSLLAAPPAHALEPGEVALGGEIIIRLRVPAGGLTIQQRGDLVQDRINELVAITDLNENDVTVLPLREGPTIFVRGRKFLTVDKATAEASGRKPDALARAWARRLAGVLPEVNVRLPGTPPPQPLAFAESPAQPDSAPSEPVGVPLAAPPPPAAP